MTVRHSITAYNKETDRLAFAADVPEMLMLHVRELLKVPEDDPHLLWSYTLTPWQLAEISKLMLIPAVSEDNEYFLESYSEQGCSDVHSPNMADGDMSVRAYG
jgi:hypothetical protein